MKRKRRITGSWADENGNVVFIFYRDGTAYLDGHWGKYSISGGEIQTVDNDGLIELEGEYKVSGKQFTLKIGGYTEVLAKKK